MQGVLDFIAQYGDYIYVNLLDVDSLRVTGDLECEGPAYFDSIETGSLTVGQHAATWQSKTVVTDYTLPSLSYTASFTVTDKTGTERTGRLVTSWGKGTLTTDTIYYLGR